MSEKCSSECPLYQARTQVASAHLNNDDQTFWEFLPDLPDAGIQTYAAIGRTVGNLLGMGGCSRIVDRGYEKWANIAECTTKAEGLKQRYNIR